MKEEKKCSAQENPVPATAMGETAQGENGNRPSEEGHAPAARCGYGCRESRPGVQENAIAYEARPEKRQGEYTIEDYYAWPEEERIELIDGVIYVMEAPGFVHQRLAGRIFSQMETYFRKKGGECIPLISPIDVRLDCDDKTMVQPDLIILCDRDKIKRWGIMGAPDFILEILSHECSSSFSTRRKDCIKKLQKCSDAGVKEYWIIDPGKRLLLTYDFTRDYLPCIYPLTGTAGLALYGDELQIDLDETAGLIQDWPD